MYRQPSLFDLPPQVMTVSEVTAYIRQKLEADLTLRELWLEGEISNWKPASSGHIYFTLKDAEASIRCVIWRGAASKLLYRPVGDGAAVLAHGRVSVYEVSGAYQFYVDELEPAGLGALYAKFERLKITLEAEGLFDPAHKRPLSRFPGRIGVVTSLGGAALRDILNVLRRRYPLAEVIVSPTPVQGEEAPAQIIAALARVAEQKVDVIILARGGGSLEDLWAFNDEQLAWAIAASPVPVVVGVGHEVDVTIADCAADLRAPTPSAAAELTTPDQAELRQDLAEYRAALSHALRQRVDAARAKLERQQYALNRLSPQVVLNNYRQRIDTLLSRARRTTTHQLSLRRERLTALASRLDALNPQATLFRGYAIVQMIQKEHGPVVITSTGQVTSGDTVIIKVRDGMFHAKVIEGDRIE
jgi:exodeoxyribonuclease VII large subunit